MPQTWIIEVLLKVYSVQHGEREEWRPYKSYTGEPYQWHSEREAQAMLDLCFGNDKLRDRVRVAEFR